MMEQPKTFHVVCDYCHKEEEINYGEAVNGEVPEGWVRAPDDKHHFCCTEHAGLYRLGARKITQEDGSTAIAYGMNPSEPIFETEWFKADPTLEPNQIRIEDEVIEINAQGGRQSHVDGAAHRLDPVAMLTLIDVLGYGDVKYNEYMCKIGDENWRKLDHYDHINHTLVHMFKYLKELQFGPAQDDPEAGQHLAHAFCRMMFALGSQHAAV